MEQAMGATASKSPRKDKRYSLFETCGCLMATHNMIHGKKMKKMHDFSCSWQLAEWKRWECWLTSTPLAKSVWVSIITVTCHNTAHVYVPRNIDSHCQRNMIFSVESIADLRLDFDALRHSLEGFNAGKLEPSCRLLCNSSCARLIFKFTYNSEHIGYCT